MQELIEIKNYNGVNVVSSRLIARKLGREHKNIVRDLDKILESSNLSSLIIPSFYRTHSQNRQYREYLLTKDGFTLYMFNIQGYIDFKMAYINKFNEMEKQVQLSISNGEVDNNLIGVLLENQKRLEEKLDSLLLKNDKDIAEPKKSKVELLPEDVREMIDKMLRKKKVNYSSIMRECAKKGVDISSNTIARYHKIQKGVM